MVDGVFSEFRISNQRFLVIQLSIVAKDKEGFGIGTFTILLIEQIVYVFPEFGGSARRASNLFEVTSLTLWSYQPSLRREMGFLSAHVTHSVCNIF